MLLCNVTQLRVTAEAVRVKRMFLTVVSLKFSLKKVKEEVKKAELALSEARALVEYGMVADEWVAPDMLAKLKKDIEDGMKKVEEFWNIMLSG